MLTRAGWAVLLGAGGLVASGRVFGIFELYLVGAAGLVLVATSAWQVRRTRLRLDIGRTLVPPRVHAGSPSRVELTIRNRGSAATPLLSLRDPVGTGRSARVTLAPLGPEESVRAAYSLPTDRRGLLPVGPLAIDLTDPFGLAALVAPGAPLTELTVWPRIDDVSPLPHTEGDDPHGGADHPNAPAAGGTDFHALRPYVVGDDLRRVHWKATARRDELMVRHDEMPWQARATVLLDTRRGAHSPETFERAVSAAASIVVACSRRKYLLRLVTTAGEDSGFAAGNAHVEALMERLATVSLVEAGRLPAVLGALKAGRGGGAMAALLGGRAPADLEAVGRTASAFGTVVPVCFAVGRPDRVPTLGTLPVVLVDDDRSFAAGWDAAVADRRGARRSVGAR